MSLQIIQQHILEFLSSSKPEVLAISGAWGVGKTFAWNQELVNCRDDKALEFDKYSYVSLFGVNSLEVLKATLFENLIDSTLIGSDPSLKSLKDNTVSMSKSLGQKSLNQIKNLPFLKNASSVLDAMSYMYVSNSLICIDDLERKGNALSSKDILGIVSQLKEQKKCKVVLLLNEASISDSPDYKEFKEKVIDKEITFNPTPSECIDLIIPNDFALIETVRECAETLSLTNMRVISKAYSLMSKCLQHCSDLDPEISRQICHTITLFTTSYYCSSSNKRIPPIDFLTANSFSRLSTEESNDHKRWRGLLVAYQFNYVDDLDKALFQIVESGFIDIEPFKATAEKTNKKLIESIQENAYREIWKEFYNSFCEEADFVERFMLITKSAISSISAANLSSSVRLLRELGQQSKASDLIEFFVSKNLELARLNYLDKYDDFGHEIDSELIESATAALNNSPNLEPTREFLIRVCTSYDTSEEDKARMSQITESEFYDFLKKESGEPWRKLLKQSSGEHAEANAKSALKKIAQESKLNEIRLKRLGLD
ncbi:hypothetical protein [Pseudoalteromonas sp. C8]|uniref:hypothetical protein n=1 Tax=Pseudoalteromonas sp. C8 TaxID=2686345 RepID=UPI0013FE4625|nr:hypothetical protein [Pseudoalteromonas sp. C8]